MDVDGLPKLEGTVAVNLALIAKFMPAYLFAPESFPAIPTRNDAADDEFLFRQGRHGGCRRFDSTTGERCTRSSRMFPTLHCSWSRQKRS